MLEKSAAWIIVQDIVLQAGFTVTDAATVLRPYVFAPGRISSERCSDQRY